jgi:DNA-nicking Smr family endonuclease
MIRQLKVSSTMGEQPRGDRGIWQRAIQGVTPLRRRPAPAREGTNPPPQPVSPRKQENETTSAPRLPTLDRFSGIDRANAERLKRGLHKIEARLDLHGMTQSEAHRALAAFVRSSRDAGLRCVLVITGRGFGPNGPGILRVSVPRWLEEPELKRQVLAIAPAKPQHGGSGASYLLLRRLR